MQLAAGINVFLGETRMVRVCVCVLLLTVLEEEMHGEIPVGDNHSKGAG